jgi:hypothetical protein
MPKPFNNSHFFGVPRVAVVDRFDCNYELWIMSLPDANPFLGISTLAVMCPLFQQRQSKDFVSDFVTFDWKKI